MKWHLKLLFCLLENRKMHRTNSWRLLLFQDNLLLYVYIQGHMYLYFCKSMYAFKFIHLILLLPFFFSPDTISLARAEEDYNASDCRFINIKKGQLIYVYSKLMNEKDSGEFWAASIRVDSCVYEQTRSRLTHIAVKKWMQMLSYCGA